MRLWLKALMVIGLTLAILIPLLLIRGVIHDRQVHRQQAVQQIASSEAGVQGITGPVLIVPWTETVEVEEKNDKGEVIRTVKRDGESGRWLFFPETLAFEGGMEPYSRRLGLHEVRMYLLEGKLTATFDAQIPADENPELPRRIGRPWLSYGIADVRGMRGSPKLRVAGRAMELLQGHGARNWPGVHVRLDAPRAGSVLALGAELDLQLAGAEQFSFAPIAQRTQVRIQSAWPHPQFNGDFLPDRRSVSSSGFSAEWQVSSLATNAQAQYREQHAQGAEHGYAERVDAFGISLVDPINPYVQADRASKYGLLFVLLTFVGFFMFELIKQLRIHAIQYGLVGLALAIFFLLLVSLSEHIAFGASYLIASVACIGLLGYYVAHVLRSRSRGLGFAAMLATLYAALYGLLISEDNALVLGAGLLFLILAAIMVSTRKIDWYQLSAAPAPKVPPIPSAAPAAAGRD